MTTSQALYRVIVIMALAVSVFAIVIAFWASGLVQDYSIVALLSGLLSITFALFAVVAAVMGK